MVLPSPNWPSLVATARGALWRAPDGDGIERLKAADAAMRAAASPPLVCHAPAVAARLGLDDLPALDLLELFAFVRPATFCLPTPRGLCEALDLAVPATPEEEVAALPAGRRPRCSTSSRTWRRWPRASSPKPRSPWRAGNGRGATPCWPRWASTRPARSSRPGAGLDVWKSLPQWEEPPPAPPPSSQPVEPREARLRLAQMVSAGANIAEARPTQSDYASAAAQAFAPREREDQPNVVLVEAGTGVGKTLGYVAPASLWAEKNGAPVWISTYTRNLQRQIDNELDRLHRDSAEKRRKVVVRKGRENYLCLLNFQEAVMRTGLAPENAVGLGLLARWALDSRDGDMVGGDLPAWLPTCSGRGRITRLADRRGECIYSACPHYRKCFVERTIRRARQADIVIANHALVMVQAAMGGLDDATRPLRYVFDEGHHLFDAADGAFAAHLSGIEASELRRWLLGAEGRRGSRARGLERRLSDLLGDDLDAPQGAAPPARPRPAAALAQLADAARRRHGARSGRGVPGPGAPAGARPRRGRGPGLRPGMRRAPAQSRPARGGGPAGPGAGADAGAGAPAAPGAAGQARERGRQARLGPARRASRAWRARSPTAAS